MLCYNVSMDATIITGNTISLKPSQAGDSWQFDTWNNDPEVTKYREVSGQDTPKLKSLSFGIYHNQTSKLIGDLGISCIDTKNKHAEIGLSIGDKNYWGKGYGTEAVKAVCEFCFSKLNLNKVYLDVWEENERAIKCYLKCGFKVDGVLRDHVWKYDKFHNKLVMSILKSEWEGQ